ARPAVPLGASGVGPVRLLRRRLTMILRGSTPRSLTAAGLLAVLAVGGLLLPLLPTRAQAPPPGEGPGPVPKKAQGDLRQAREELQRALADIEAKRAHLEKQRQEFERD